MSGKCSKLFRLNCLLGTTAFDLMVIIPLLIYAYLIQWRILRKLMRALRTGPHPYAITIHVEMYWIITFIIGQIFIASHILGISFGRITIFVGRLTGSAVESLLLFELEIACLFLRMNTTLNWKSIRANGTEYFAKRSDGGKVEVESDLTVRSYNQADFIDNDSAKYVPLNF